MIRSDMRIESIRMVEIGAFDDCTLEFPKNTKPDLAEVHIFTGPNGCGKSTALYCMAALFAHPGYINYKPWVDVLRRFRSDEKSSLLAKRFDFQYEYNWHGNTSVIGASRWVHRTEVLAAFATNSQAEAEIRPFLQSSWQRQNFAFLPLAYSGHRPMETNQGALAIKELESSPLKEHLAFGQSIDPNLIAQWIANIETKEALSLKKGDTEEAKKRRQSLDVVIRAISEITGNKFEFSLDDKTLEVLVKRDNVQVTFDVLPDGLKSIISWIADVLMRMDRLPWEKPDTPLLEQPLILFLDEIDIHLHPKWQRKVLPMVQRLFPNAQIFVSTHSPFVVGSVEDAWVYKLDGKLKEILAEPSGAGKSYEVVLEEVFGIAEHFDDATQSLIAELKQERNKLLAKQTSDIQEYQRIAQKLAAKSEELDGIVALDIRQLAQHGVVISLPQNEMNEIAHG